MAWLPRAQWIRRRYGHYAGRARTFRRQFYRRPWFNRRRYIRGRRSSRVFPRRRLRVSKWMPVRQHNPRNVVKCTIGGWMPALLCIPAAPMFRPMKMSSGNPVRTGGWTIHELTLKAFFEEYKIYRNSWSRSNCGFDLARYLGTTITMYPTEETDYIVWWDVDYASQEEFELILRKVHPALMLGRPHTRVVLSRKTSLRYKKKRIFVPPPAKYKNEWETQKTWNDRGLAIIAVAVIDFTWPWVVGKMEEFQPSGNDQKPQWKLPWSLWDYTRNTDTKMSEVMKKGETASEEKLWWNANSSKNQQLPTLWADDWPGWKETNYQVLTRSNIVAVSQGPFVRKYPGAECQIIWTYRSHWKWGGDVALSRERICDPGTLQPVQRAKRYVTEPVDPAGYLTMDDIRKDGFIKPEAFQRITRGSSKRFKFSNYGRETSDEEEEPYPDHYIPTSSSEEEDPGEGTSRLPLPRRKFHRSRIEHFNRLRYFLKHLMQNKKSFSD
nr:MAG: ORF1 [Giant panda anellovirus]